MSMYFDYENHLDVIIPVVIATYAVILGLILARPLWKFPEFDGSDRRLFAILVLALVVMIVSAHVGMVFGLYVAIVGSREMLMATGSGSAMIGAFCLGGLIISLGFLINDSAWDIRRYGHARFARRAKIRHAAEAANQERKGKSNERVLRLVKSS
jgi:hypothetical protein